MCGCQSLVLRACTGQPFFNAISLSQAVLINPYPLNPPISSNEDRERQNTGWGFMGLVMAGKGERGHAAGFPRSEQSQTTHETGALHRHTPSAPFVDVAQLKFACIGMVLSRK